MPYYQIDVFETTGPEEERKTALLASFVTNAEGGFEAFGNAAGAFPVFFNHDHDYVDEDKTTAREVITRLESAGEGPHVCQLA